MFTNNTPFSSLFPGLFRIHNNPHMPFLLKHLWALKSQSCLPRLLPSSDLFAPLRLFKTFLSSSYILPGSSPTHHKAASLTATLLPLPPFSTPHRHPTNAFLFCPATSTTKTVSLFYLKFIFWVIFHTSSPSPRSTSIPLMCCHKKLLCLATSLFPLFFFIFLVIFHTYSILLSAPPTSHRCVVTRTLLYCNLYYNLTSL